MLAETMGGVHDGVRRSRDDDSDVFADLVRRIQAGDRLALEPLLEHARRTAYRFSVLVCGNAPDAVDTMQDALLKTCRYAASIRKPEYFREWLYRTVRNACLMRRRRRVHEPDRLLSIDQWGRIDGGTCRVLDPSCGPEAGMVNSHVVAEVRRAFSTLSPKYRAALFLREIEHLSTREAAGVMGVSEANVKARLLRAKRQMRKALAEFQHTTAADAPLASHE